MLWDEFISGDSITGKQIEEEFIWMRRYAFQYGLQALGEEAFAEDFSHTTLERVLSRLQSRGEITRSYYRELVRYTFLDTLRNRKKDALHRPRTVNGSRETAEELPEEYIETIPGYQVIEPDRALYGEELRVLFREVLSSLDTLKRRIVIQRILGISAREISRNLGNGSMAITPNHIGVIYHGFKKKLRDCLIRHKLQTE